MQRTVKNGNSSVQRRNLSVMCRADSVVFRAGWKLESAFCVRKVLGEIMMSRKFAAVAAILVAVVTLSVFDAKDAKAFFGRRNCGGCSAPACCEPVCSAPVDTCCGRAPRCRVRRTRCCAPVVDSCCGPRVRRHRCCGPVNTCCAPAPACCTPAPTCCHTAPSCCAPAAPCCGAVPAAAPAHVEAAAPAAPAPEAAPAPAPAPPQ